jgi:transposase-like protein
VLGLYLSESEGANFWLSGITTDAQNRGVEEILIASVNA